VKELRKPKHATKRSFKRLPQRLKSLPVSLEIRAKSEGGRSAVYHLKAVNPHKRPVLDERGLEQIIKIIDTKSHEIPSGLDALGNTSVK